MKSLTLAVGALAVVAGSLGGIRAYATSSGSPPPTPVTTVAHPMRPQPVRPGVVLRWAPCRAPAVREGRACVTHVTRVVTVPAPVVARPTTASAPRPHSAPPRPHATAPSPEPSDDPPASGEPGDDGDNGGDHGDDGGHDDGGGDDG